MWETYCSTNKYINMCTLLIATSLGACVAPVTCVRRTFDASVRQLTAVSSAARQLLALFERAVGGALADAVTLLFGG